MPSVGNQETWLHEQLGKRHRVAILIVAAAALAFGASLGVAWAAGFGPVAHALIHPNWIWLSVAVAGEAVAYVGYTFAYRDVVRAEGGADLRVPKTAALVATGFGVFVQAGALRSTELPLNVQASRSGKPVRAFSGSECSSTWYLRRPRPSPPSSSSSITRALVKV